MSGTLYATFARPLPDPTFEQRNRERYVPPEIVHLIAMLDEQSPDINLDQGWEGMIPILEPIIHEDLSFFARVPPPTVQRAIDLYGNLKPYIAGEEIESLARRRSYFDRKIGEQLNSDELTRQRNELEERLGDVAELEWFTREAILDFLGCSDPDLWEDDVFSCFPFDSVNASTEKGYIIGPQMSYQIGYERGIRRGMEVFESKMVDSQLKRYSPEEGRIAIRKYFPYEYEEDTFGPFTKIINAVNDLVGGYGLFGLRVPQATAQKCVDIMSAIDGDRAATFIRDKMKRLNTNGSYPLIDRLPKRPLYNPSGRFKRRKSPERIAKEGMDEILRQYQSIFDALIERLSKLKIIGNG